MIPDLDKGIIKWYLRTVNQLPFPTHRQGEMIALTPIQRKAAFMAAVTLRGSTRMAAAAELGVSWTHLLGVLDGLRTGSAELKRRIAIYVGMPVDQLFPETKAA
jgi:chemotaxis protein histidine kinase CheA